MPQLRQDRLTQEWVFVATDSAARLHELVVKRARQPRPSLDPHCPLCPGNEGRSAPEVLRVPSAGKPGWAVRVISDKATTLSVESDLPRPAVCSSGEAEGLSVHEVIVETPDHSLSTALLPESQLFTVLRTAKARYHELSLDPRLAHVTFCKKQGPGAGAALDHPHWQLAATETVPAQVSSALLLGRRHYGRFTTCIFCTVLQEELESQTRIVLASEHFVALEPYASPSPFCTHIYPRRHAANFGEIQAGEIHDLARILHDVLARFCHGLDDPDFHCTLRTAPVADAGVAFFHWSLSIVPCLAPAAAATQGRDRFMNTVLPEAAAEFLRAGRVAQAIPA